MKRSLDITWAIVWMIILSPLLVLVAMFVKLTSRGPVFHISIRIGTHNKSFRMYKFRTMTTGTPNLPKHLLVNPDQYLTGIGRILRKLSLDELPQLLNILKGEMSFVGPRPVLHNHSDLIDLRTDKGIHKLSPGLTGWAQVNGRDRLMPSAVVDHDEFYMNNKSISLDLKIISKTFVEVVKISKVSH